MRITSTPPGLTKEGYQIQFGSNHMGRALLTKLLLSVLGGKKQPNTWTQMSELWCCLRRPTAIPRLADFKPDLVKVPEALPAEKFYGQSKLANLLYARQLAKVYPQFTVTLIHPGVVQTTLFRGATGTSPSILVVTWLVERSATSVEEAVFNQLWAPLSKDVRSGEYSEPVGVVNTASGYGKDNKLAKKLRDLT